MIWEYFSSAKEKEAKEAVSKAKKKVEERQLAEALEVGGCYAAVTPVLVLVILYVAIIFLSLCRCVRICVYVYTDVCVTHMLYFAV